MHGKLLRSKQLRHSRRPGCLLTKHSISLGACRGAAKGLADAPSASSYKSESWLAIGDAC